MDESGDSPFQLNITQQKDNVYRVWLPKRNYRNLLSIQRPAEVSMIIQRTPGWLLLQTKQHYPPGVFRIPTGVIMANEKPEETMLRELLEESNLVPIRYKHLFRLEYEVENGRSDFFTESFFIEAPQGELKPNDLSEGISAWREAQFTELPQVAGDLRQLESPRDGWGLFRSAVHQLAGEILSKEPP